jgi:hypothetical protein
VFKLTLSTLLLFAVCSEAHAGDLLARVESTEFRVNGKLVDRIQKDGEGNVIRLQLNEMQLSAKDFEALGGLSTLRSLSLYRTNVTNEDLRCIRDLPHLEFLVLTSTDVSDGAIEHIKRMRNLRTVCAGNVLITPDAVAKLKKDRPRLVIGYSQRKP